MWWHHGPVTLPFFCPLEGRYIPPHLRNREASKQGMYHKQTQWQHLTGSWISRSRLQRLWQYCWRLLHRLLDCPVQNMATLSSAFKCFSSYCLSPLLSLACATYTHISMGQLMGMALPGWEWMWLEARPKLIKLFGSKLLIALSAETFHRSWHQDPSRVLHPLGETRLWSCNLT